MFSTLQGLVLTSKRQLLMIKGLSDQKIMKCLDIGRKNLVGGMSIPGQYATGLQVMEMRKSVRQITTGSAQFDSLLGGGFESQSLTEIYGEFRTGKTQVSHTLCVTGQLGYDIGGGQGKVLFIDTEVWFRIKQYKDCTRLTKHGSLLDTNLTSLLEYFHSHGREPFVQSASKRLLSVST